MICECGCKELIIGRYVRIKGKAYCEEHFCCSESGCNKSVIGGYFIDQKSGRMFCKEHFSKTQETCFVCDKPCIGISQTIAVLGHVYHHACFRCFYCKRAVDQNEIFSRNHQLLCVEHRFESPPLPDKINNNFSQLHVDQVVKLPQVLCITCNKKIIGQSVTVNERVYHADCFRCSHCGLPIASKFFSAPPPSNAVYCRGHFEQYAADKCPVCQKRMMEDARIKAEGILMHKQCFACCVCNVKLGTEYFYKLGHFFCSQHLNEDVPTPVSASASASASANVTTTTTTTSLTKSPSSSALTTTDQFKLSFEEQKEMGELANDVIKIVKAMLKATEKRTLLEMAQLVLQYTNKMYDRSVEISSNSPFDSDARRIPNYTSDARNDISVIVAALRDLINRTDNRNQSVNIANAAASRAESACNSVLKLCPDAFPPPPPPSATPIVETPAPTPTPAPASTSSTPAPTPAPTNTTPQQSPQNRSVSVSAFTSGSPKYCACALPFVEHQFMKGKCRTCRLLQAPAGSSTVPAASTSTATAAATTATTATTTSTAITAATTSAVVGVAVNGTASKAADNRSRWSSTSAVPSTTATPAKLAANAATSQPILQTTKISTSRDMIKDQYGKTKDRSQDGKGKCFCWGSDHNCFCHCHDDEPDYLKAIATGDEELFRSSIRQLADLKDFLIDTESLLHLVARRGWVKGIDILLDKQGKDQDFLDLKNFEKETALHLAARCGNMEALNLLINSGATLTKNIEGKTAIDVTRMGNVKAVTLFQRVKVKIYVSSISSTMTVRANTESLQQLLSVKRITYEEVDLSMTPELLVEMESKSKTRKLPQLFINDFYLGGLDEIQMLEDEQIFDKLLFGQLIMVDKSAGKTSNDLKIRSETAMLLDHLGLSLKLLDE